MVVVGGGVLGMMHAAAARQRGYQVVQLEREAGSRGATVRNFGLVWVSGRAPGAELALALRARELWEELAAVVPGTGFRPHGSLTLAADDAEAAVLREAACLPDACSVATSSLIQQRCALSTPAPSRVLMRAALHQGRHRRAPAGTCRDPRLPACSVLWRRICLAARAGGGRDRARRRTRPQRYLAPRAGSGSRRSVRPPRTPARSSCWHSGLMAASRSETRTPTTSRSPSTSTRRPTITARPG